MDWINEMQMIRETSLPKRYFSAIPQNVQLHIFCDASLEAMCTVAYFRAETDAGNEVLFVLGECRIAPIKQFSIPRLELQTALCSVRLRKLIVEEYDFLLTVLHIGQILFQYFNGYIQQIESRMYFAKRAAEILEASTTDEWKHIKGELNPSDIGTRGITIEKLSESDLLSGPTWLKDQYENGPVSFAPVSSVIEDHTQVAEIANNSKVGDSPIDWNRFSSFSKCVRAITYCLRLKYKSQSKVLNSDELQRAEEGALKLIQIETIFDFCNGKQDVQKTNKGGNLAKFSLICDEKGLIRVRGRIKEANLSFEQRHPILLSTKHEKVTLMFRDLHQEHNHERFEYARSVVQQKFRILGLRNALRSIKSQCVFCRKLRAQMKVALWLIYQQRCLIISHILLWAWA